MGPRARFALAAAVILALSMPASAQTLYGSLVGNVTDDAGLAVHELMLVVVDGLQDAVAHAQVFLRDQLVAGQQRFHAARFDDEVAALGALHRAGDQRLAALEEVVQDLLALRVADALDMAKGRSRVPFERGSMSMHSISAAAIDEVRITDGDGRPVMVEVVMNNSSGIYRVDGLLKAKLRGSGLEPYVEVVARIETDAEKLLIPTYRLDFGDPRT